jgi:hypothetical protein
MARDTQLAAARKRKPMNDTVKAEIVALDATDPNDDT